MDSFSRSASLPVDQDLRRVRDKVRHFERICSSLQGDALRQWQLSRTPYTRRTSTASRLPSTPHPNTSQQLFLREAATAADVSLLTEEKAELDRKLLQAKDEVKRLKLEMSKRNSETAFETESLKQHLLQQEIALQEARAKLASKDDALQKSESALGEVRSQLDTHQKQVSEQERSLREAQEEVVQLVNLIEEKETQLDVLETELEELRQQCSRCDAKLCHLDELSTLHRTVKELRARLDCAEEQRAQQKKSASIEAEEKYQQSEQKYQQAERTVAELELAVNQLQELVAELEENLRERDLEEMGYVRALYDSHSATREAEEQLNAYRAAHPADCYSRLEAQLDELHQRLEEQDDELASSQVQVNELAQQNEDFEMENEQLRARLQAARQEGESWRHELKQRDHELELLRVELNHIKSAREEEFQRAVQKGVRSQMREGLKLRMQQRLKMKEDFQQEIDEIRAQYEEQLARKDRELEQQRLATEEEVHDASDAVIDSMNLSIAQLERQLKETRTQHQDELAQLGRQNKSLLKENEQVHQRLQSTLVQLQENTQELKLKRREVLRLKGRIYCTGDEEGVLVDPENSAAFENQSAESRTAAAAPTSAACTTASRSDKHGAPPPQAAAKNSFSYTRRRTSIASPLAKIRQATRRRASSSSLAPTPAAVASSSQKSASYTAGSSRRRQTLAVTNEVSSIGSPLRRANTIHSQRR